MRLPERSGGVRRLRAVSVTAATSTFSGSGTSDAPSPHVADVVNIARGSRRDRRPPPGRAAALVVGITAVVLAASPLWAGYYDFSRWAPLALGAVMLLVFVALTGRAAVSGIGLVAAGALVLLLLLSATSMLWAQSREGAWTDTNKLALYAVLFGIGALAVRSRNVGRIVLLILGASALITTVLLAFDLIVTGDAGAFVTGRLNSPMGYINATAGLLVMGVWPWLGLADTAERAWLRATAVGFAAGIAAMAVLTQSRATVPATIVTATLVVFAAPGATRRAVNLLLIAAAIALTLHWTLPVYTSTGPFQLYNPSSGALHKAGFAIVIAALLAGGARYGLSRVMARRDAAARTRTLHVLGRAMAVAAALFVVAVVAVGHNTISRQYDDFTQLKLDQSAPDRFLSGGGFRYDLWRAAWDEFKEHPIGGVGAGSYDLEYTRLRQNPQYVIVPHSIELQFAADLGIGGLILLLTFCGAVIYAGVTRRRPTLASGDPMLKIGALGMFTAFLTGTSVDWLYDFPGLAGAAFLCAGMLVLPAAAEEEPAARPASRSVTGQKRPVALAVGIAMLALIAASIGRQYAASRYAESGASQVDSAPRQAISTLRTASELDPDSLQTLFSIASAYAKLDDYPDARAILLHAASLEPNNYVPPALLGDIAMQAQYYAVAKREYQRALSLTPRDPTLVMDVQQAQAAMSARGRR